MDVNGENMGRRRPKEIHALELIIAAPWLQVVLLRNRYLSIIIASFLNKSDQSKLSKQVLHDYSNFFNQF